MFRKPAQLSGSSSRTSEIADITRDEVVLLWENIEFHRAAIAQALAIFEGWLEVLPELYKDWCESTRSAG